MSPLIFSLGLYLFSQNQNLAILVRLTLAKSGCLNLMIVSIACTLFFSMLPVGLPVLAKLMIYMLICLQSSCNIITFSVSMSVSGLIPDTALVIILVPPEPVDIIQPGDDTVLQCTTAAGMYGADLTEMWDQHTATVQRFSPSGLISACSSVHGKLALDVDKRGTESNLDTRSLEVSPSDDSVRMLDKSILCWPLLCDIRRRLIGYANECLMKL